MGPTTQPAGGERQPERTCAGCRRRAPQSALIRYVADQAGRLRVDAQRRAPGRGVYVCPEASCLRLACSRAALARGLRRKLCPTDPGDLARISLEEVRAAADRVTREGTQDGRVRPAGTNGLRVVDERLSRRLQAFAEQARRLEGGDRHDPDRNAGSRPDGSEGLG